MTTRAEGDSEQGMVFVVKITSFGRGDENHQRQVAAFLWQQLNRGFGADRCELWHEGDRIFFDPLAAEGEKLSENVRTGHDL
jgi:hypothetical protein